MANHEAEQVYQIALPESEQQSAYQLALPSTDPIVISYSPESVNRAVPCVSMDLDSFHSIDFSYTPNNWGERAIPTDERILPPLHPKSLFEKFYTKLTQD